MTRVCIVDCFSTGLELKEELAKLGARVSHIVTSEEYGGRHWTTLACGDFDHTWHLKSGLNEVLSRAMEWRPAYIVPGCEHGIEIADLLNERIGLKHSNPARSTAWRRSKYEMHQRLADAGLSRLEQRLFHDYAEFHRYLEKKDLPVVVKPVRSACSDNVYICNDLDQATEAFGAIMGSTDFLGAVNTHVLVQDYLDGVQYFVNTVSREGEHFVTDIWRHDRRRRPGGAFLFENMVLSDAASTTARVLADYTRRVLDCLEVRFGAGHNEVILTADGPVLVEVNARLMGGVIYRPALERGLGYTQAEVLAEAIAQPKNFEARIGTRYQLRECVAEASFIFPQSGVLSGFPRRDEIERLETFHSFVDIPRLGELVRATTDTSGSSGYAYFVHRDRTKVERDAAQLLKWQRENSVFRIAAV